MKATVQRVRESVYMGTYYRVSCLNFVIQTKDRFSNGEHAILVEDKDGVSLRKLSKLFEKLSIGESIELTVGQEVTEYFE